MWFADLGIVHDLLQGHYYGSCCDQNDHQNHMIEVFSDHVEGLIWGVSYHEQVGSIAQSKDS